MAVTIEDITYNVNAIDWTGRDTGFIPEDNDVWYYYNNSSYPNTVIYLIGDGTNTIESLTLYTIMNDQIQNIDGIKTFGSIPILPASDPTTDNQAVRKKWIDDNVVKLTGAQTVAGEKTLTTNPRVENAAPGYTLTETDSLQDWAIKAGGGNFVIVDETLSAVRVTINSTSGNASFAANLSIVGALSKGSGSFKIDHPLKPDTHHLVHSFVESPYADNIYSGMVTLKSGKAKIDIDKQFNMTSGTLEALNTTFRRFTSNESGFIKTISKLKGSVLTIEAENKDCNDEIFWQVIGERHDKHILDTQWTDKKGRVIIEPKREETLTDEKIRVVKEKGIVK